MLQPGQTLRLSRGGLLIGTPAGNVQYSAVPETIKDTMMLEDGVPSIFVVPHTMFSPERGISLAELEFPAYYNFFLRQKKVTVVCRPKQRSKLVQILSRSLFGPEYLDEKEFGSGSDVKADDLRAEMTYFSTNPLKGGKPLELGDLVEIIEFDERGRARLDSSTLLELEDDGGFSVAENGRSLARAGCDPPLPPLVLAYDEPLSGFHRPILGVSVIGSGHGFDAGNRTSGFIVWIDGKGVMVDPPVDSTEWLRGYDVSPKQVDTLILTHCHADHDAGTLQKIMHEGRITIYTTPSVMDNFVSKYSALTDISRESFRKLFDFVAVRSGQTFYLNGAEVTFRYSLHSIPCAGFEIRRGGRSLVYPSDTLNDPDRIHQLHETGIISTERRDMLLRFPWHHDLVLHEAGIPPIHTPVETLDRLPEDVKKRMFLVHVSSKQLVKTRELKVAPTGLENTIDLQASRQPIDDPIEVLDAMSRVEFLSELPLARASEFLRMIRREEFKAGEIILRQGESGTRFYLILEGKAAIIQNGEVLKVYSDYDFFGETALVLDQPRTADVLARTDLVLLSLEHSDFLHLIRGTDLKNRLTHLAMVRTLPTWDLLMANAQLGAKTSSQMTQLQAVMNPCELPPGPMPSGQVILIEEGEVVARLHGSDIQRFAEGEIVGDVHALGKGRESRFEFEVIRALRGYQFQAEEFRGFLQRNPGMYVRLRAILPAIV